MNKKQKVTLVISVGLMACAMLTYVVSASASYEEQIKSISKQALPSSEGYSDKMAALGPDAIPAIAAALLKEGERFTSTYYKALVKIGDKRAVLPLLAFLAKSSLITTPEGYAPHDALAAIRALGTFHDSRAMPAVLSIFNDTSLHIKMRLFAAATLAQVSDDATRQMAEDFVMLQHSKLDVYYRAAVINKAVNQTDVMHALIAVDSEKSLKMVLTYMGYGPNSYEVAPLMDYFATKDRQDVFEVLLAAIKLPDLYEPETRLLILEALANQTHRMDTRLLLPYLDEFVYEITDFQREYSNNDEEEIAIENAVKTKRIDALRKRLLAQQ
ncbi:MAG: HEAT repeat protein [Phenylobacterium sp.]|jgi:HEAT repeat protein